MTNNSVRVQRSTNTPPAQENQYAQNLPTFTSSAKPTETDEIADYRGYRVFISASGDVMGSYSTTARQDAYRTLNSSGVSGSTKR
jgi:hypothetical protein